MEVDDSPEMQEKADRVDDILTKHANVVAYDYNEKKAMCTFTLR